jgi:hypothetical protein
MSPDISDLTAGLDLADGYLTLRMWEEAWNAIEDLPSYWKNHPDSLKRRIDALTGLGEWEKATTLAVDVVSIFSRRADLWHRLARLQAHAGDFKAARGSVAKCVELDGQAKIEILRDENARWYLVDTGGAKIPPKRLPAALLRITTSFCSGGSM